MSRSHPFSRRVVLGAGGLALVASLIRPARAAATMEVGTAAQLQAALADAGPGSVIRLRPGEYGLLEAAGLAGSPARPVVLEAADPAQPPRLSGLQLTAPRHLLLDGLRFDYDFRPGDQRYRAPFRLSEAKGVAIRNCLFDGDRARDTGGTGDGFGSGYGLHLPLADGIAVTGCEIRGFLRGIALGQGRNVVIAGNDIHSLRMDGITFTKTHGILIEGNHIHDFVRAPEAGDHADMIQCWTVNGPPASAGITIRRNVLNSGGGMQTQGIFLRNEFVDTRKGGKEMFYRNVLIEQNVIVNAHLNGLVVGETVGLTVRNNTLVRNAASAGGRPARRSAPAIRLAPASRDVRIERNVAYRIMGVGDGGNWHVAGNLLVQDESRTQPGFYGAVFVADALRHPDRLASFAPRPGGPLDGTGIGADRLATRSP